jgi:hypothetical protein
MNQFYPRAPRFILKSDENMSLRFAPLRTKGQAFESDLLDVSASGLAFQIQVGDPVALTLEEGTILKIEFTLPRDLQIACFATLTRIEALTTWDPSFGPRHSYKVAVQFRNLPKQHLLSLQKSFRGLNHAETPLKLRPSLRSLLALSTSTAAMAGFFYLMALPIDIWLRFL